MAIVQPVESSNGHRRFRVSCPTNAEVIGEVSVTNAEEVRAAVARARAAQPGWAALSFDERARFMYRALGILMKQQERFMEVIMRETGRSRFETVMMEIF